MFLDSRSRPTSAGIEVGQFSITILILVLMQYVRFKFGRCCAWLPAVYTVPMPVPYTVVMTLASNVTTPAHE